MKAAKSFITVMRGNTQIENRTPSVGNKHATMTIGTGSPSAMPLKFTPTQLVSPIGGKFSGSNDTRTFLKHFASEAKNKLPMSAGTSGAGSKKTPRKMPW